MPKKILYESAVHQFLWAASRLRARLAVASPTRAQTLAAWIAALHIDNPGGGALRLTWSQPAPGNRVIDYKGAKFYTRGDTAAHSQQQMDAGLVGNGDRVMGGNMAFFDQALRAVLVEAGMFSDAELADGSTATMGADAERKAAEEAFHDEWAASEAGTIIDVRKRNEACTAPEMRALRKALGDLRGKELLDVGCGLGEASVYFALEGARVTATDVSPGMCAATQRLANAENVQLETHVSAAEDLRLGNRQFDIIYIGNTLHHVDIKETMDRLLPHLRSGGTFVSWDPVAYNPLINIYRRVATEVRTPDEHPLRLRDIKSVTSRFAAAEVRWFWFSTLLLFVWMVAVQRRNPNRERFWKKVIDESERWEKIYRPLEKFDTWALQWLPFLRPLCWNVVIIGRSPLGRASPRDA
ncbi:MAG TPA: class I SAM-dependent methyltransferase [Opitutaceae bacterium]|nr:class I SAM-dependent methyltransferase [Opitutaceae bacterium]